MQDRLSKIAEFAGYKLTTHWAELEPGSPYHCWYAQVFGPDGGFLPSDRCCRTLEEAQAHAETLMREYAEYLGRRILMDVKLTWELQNA